MSELESFLHVLRMPAPDAGPVNVTRVQFTAFLVGVLALGTLVLVGFHRWL